MACFSTCNRNTWNLFAVTFEMIHQRTHVCIHAHARCLVYSVQCTQLLEHVHVISHLIDNDCCYHGYYMQVHRKMLIMQLVWLGRPMGPGASCQAMCVLGTCTLWHAMCRNTPGEGEGLD